MSVIASQWGSINKTGCPYFISSGSLPNPPKRYISLDLYVFKNLIFKRIFDMAYWMPFLSGTARLCRVITESDVGVETVFMQAISATCDHSNLVHPERSHAGIYLFGGLGKEPQCPRIASTDLND
jgi:hypothetical protein